MKQNEKILVYAVTGFLVVILMIAIVFGKDGSERREADPSAGLTGIPGSLEDMLRDGRGDGGGADPAAGDPAAGDPAAGDPAAGDRAVDPGSGQPADPAGDLAPGNEPGNASGENPADDPLLGPGGRPLAVSVPVLPPTPAALVTEKLGLNRREHDFRIVRARPGDSLSSLVQKWCGTTTDYLDMARGLNEELSVLDVGEEVVLPWVDDEEILAAWEERQRRPATGNVGVPAEASLGNRAAGVTGPTLTPPPAAATASRKYKVQPGDSLWKIAERAVGRSGAPAFLDKVRSLNPGLDVDRLKVGQTIVLPR